MNNYSHGKHTFKLDYPTYDGTVASHEVAIEVGRSRGMDDLDVHTWIGIFHDEKFTGISINAWGDEDNQSSWVFTFQDEVLFDHAAFIKRLVDWLPEQDFLNFLEDLAENKRWEGQFTDDWQRGCQF